MQSDLQSQAVSEVFNDGQLKDETLVSKEERFRILEEAMNEFAMKIEIFDPLDRDILNEDEENQAITREELMKEIVDLQPMVGSSSVSYTHLTLPTSDLV